mmetsp:Transcript_64636/g.179516  ORF Transcript_64636/g.179516 Transcript_64636/m.179516 type:complete len:143 (-) Transcript_64636:3456-3884(-)
MCKKCRLLGALINAGRSNEERFKTGETLACCDFRPDAAFVLQFKDKLAEAYLEPAVQTLRQNGIDMVPIEVDSDGSCLTHAVSRSLYVERGLQRGLWGFLCDNLHRDLLLPAPASNCLQELTRPLQVRGGDFLRCSSSRSAD